MADRGSSPSVTAPQSMVAAAIETQCQALRALLDDPKRPLKSKAIHDARVAIRRLLSALELAEVIGHEVAPRTARRLRKLLSRLSPARDAHVQIRSLTPLRATRPEAELVIDTLKQRKKAATRKARKRLESFARADFDRDTSLVYSALAAFELTPGSSPALGQALRGELAKRHLRIEQHRRNASPSDPAELHRVRLLLKEYRYALEVAAPLLPEGAQQLVTLCEQLQEELGRAHDAHVLARTTAKLANAGDEQRAHSLVALQQELERTGQAAHEAGARALAAAQLEWPFHGAG